MKYAVEMGSDAVIYKYIASLIKIGSTIAKMMEMDDSQTDATWWFRKPSFVF
jgi:hypothetical protein